MSSQRQREDKCVKLIIEMFTMVITITVAVILFTSVIDTNNQIVRARDFYNIVINHIEDSDCNEEVIDNCVVQAKKRGYELTVKDIIKSASQNSRLVILKYYISFPIAEMFGKEKKKEAVMQGYAG